MRSPLRAAGFLALMLAAAVIAHASLATPGFTGDDAPFLVRAGSGTGTLPAGEGPLARASLGLAWILWARGATWSEGAVRAVRIENLLLLLAAAACARLVLRRALSPWAGFEGARAAAGACAVLLVCHPGTVPAVASAGARGDLLAALLSLGAAALYLRGRQEKRPPEIAGAAACAVLAGCASAAALLLPPLLASLELLCARPHRALATRLRTAATTLVGFTACVLVQSILGPAFGSPAILPRGVRTPFDGDAGNAGDSLARLAAGLGTVALPATGALWITVAAAILLLALQPALVAARSAPRSWGWIVSAVLLGVLAALWVSPLAATVMACAGLAVASTALSGARRVLIPAAIAAGFVCLSRAAAIPWTEAERALTDLRASLAAARLHHGGDARYLVAMTDERDAGLSAAGPALPLLLDPSVCATARRGDAATLDGLPRAALRLLAQGPELAEMRREGLVLIGMRAGASARRESVRLPPPEPSTGTLAWRGDLRSQLFDVDPLELRALRAVALPSASTAEAPRMGWRVGEADTHAHTGIWTAGPTGPVALFDLSSSPQWMLGPRVRRVWLEPENGRIASAELLPDLPAGSLVAEPVVEGEVWTFQVESPPSPRPLHGEARYVLALLDLATLRYVELPPEAAPPGAVEFRSIAPLPSLVGSRVAWSLELRAGDACIARASGRR